MAKLESAFMSRVFVSCDVTLLQVHHAVCVLTEFCPACGSKSDCPVKDEVYARCVLHRIYNEVFEEAAFIENNGRCRLKGRFVRKEIVCKKIEDTRLA